MRAVQVSRPNGPLEIVERPIPEAGRRSGPGRVQACGICHSDALTKEGASPGIAFSARAGAQVAGVIDAVGGGRRMAAGPYGWGRRVERRIAASAIRSVAGVLRLRDRPGDASPTTAAYADYVVAPASAIALMPADLPAIRGGTAHCAPASPRSTRSGNAGARRATSSRFSDWAAGPPGRAVRPPSGLHTVGIARGKDKEALAPQLAASSTSTASGGSAAELQNWARQSDSGDRHQRDAMSAVQGGLAVNGTMLASDGRLDAGLAPCSFDGCRSVKGWYSTSIDSQDTLAVQRPHRRAVLNEESSLERAAERLRPA